MPIKGYIAGRPVSRWDAETDNIDIDYRNLDGRGLGPCRCLEECQSGKKGCVVKILVCVVLFSVGLIIGYVIRRNVHEKIIAKTPPCPPAAIIKHTIQDFNQTVSDEIKKRLDHTPNYNLTLYDYSTYIRLAGMPLNNQGLSSTKKWLETFEPDPVFDSIKMKSYSVTLSYPDMASPTLSYVGIVANGTEVFRSHSNATVDHREYMAFSAYSPSKTVQGKPVYVNYGCVEDFRMLESRGVIVNNTIVIIRYGKIHPGNKVKHAEDWGALGVVLYPDPYDFANQQTSASSDSWWLPGWAIQSQHVRAELSGDPAFKGTDFSGTPGGPEGSKSYPSIPVQPINYDDATELLKNLGGDLVDMDWKGSLPVEYNSGPGYMGEDNNRTVKLFVRNIIQQRLINNLLAVIHGQYEKDQYVIVGAHHDSFSWGTIDAGTGYAVLIELAKSFGRYRKNGWRPRRTIIFAFWDASKYGHIGAYEWVQSNAKQLGAGAVAYINLDSLIRGNYSFYAESSPMLRDVVLAAARSVACADPEHGPGTSLYDMWARKLPREDTDPEQPVPKVPSLGGDSDYAPFLYYLGVPSLAPAYTYNLNAFNTLPNYPAYSTLYDMYNYLIRHVDPELRLTTTVSKVIAEVTLQLSDSAILPLSVAQLGDVMEDGWNSIQTFISGFKDNNISLETLRTTINEFKDTAGNFTACAKSINVSTWNEWDIRTVNDQMLRVSRVFIVDAGLPGTPHYRHTLMSPHPENLNSQLVFPGVLGPLLRGQSPREWAQVKEQLTILITSIQSAIDILNNSFIS